MDSLQGLRKEYLINNNIIILNDCMDELKSMQSETIDVVVTSPPYNVNVEYNSYVDNKEYEEHLNWLFEISKEVKRVLKTNGSYFLNVAFTNKNPIMSHELPVKISKILTLQNDIVWVKSITVKENVYGEEESFGHFKPITSKRWLNRLHESVFHFTKNGEVELDRLSIGVPYIDKNNISRWTEKEDKRCRGNVWFIPYKTSHGQKDKYFHPAGFPEELVENCLKLHGLKKEMKVLDIFSGSGTTLAVCKKLNVCGIGIEIDENYVNLTKMRLEN